MLPEEERPGGFDWNEGDRPAAAAQGQEGADAAPQEDTADQNREQNRDQQ